MSRVGVRIILVNGPPGSGKSTVAGFVADALGLPLIAKDTIKEALMDVIEVTDIETSQQLGRAAIETMWALVAQARPGAVIDANLDRAFAIDRLRALDASVIEVFCRCPLETALDRYRRRQGVRHPGHLDALRAADSFARAGGLEPVAGGWPVIEVDTDFPIDVEALVTRILRETPAD